MICPSLSNIVDERPVESWWRDAAVIDDLPTALRKEEQYGNPDRGSKDQSKPEYPMPATVLAQYAS